MTSAVIESRREGASVEASINASVLRTTSPNDTPDPCPLTILCGKLCEDIYPVPDCHEPQSSRFAANGIGNNGSHQPH